MARADTIGAFPFSRAAFKIVRPCDAQHSGSSPVISTPNPRISRQSRHDHIAINPGQIGDQVGHLVIDECACSLVHRPHTPSAVRSQSAIRQQKETT
jgi:hypothetical protein